MQKVAVVIPCRNEVKHIEACVKSMLNNERTNYELEILVCDGLSDDGTVEIIKELNTKHSEVIYLENEKRTTPFALNLGIKNTDADVVIIFGAHAEMTEDYITECLKTFGISDEIGCVGGLLNNSFKNDTSRYVSLAMSSPFGVGNVHFRTGAKEGYVDTVAFGAYKREVFNKIGLFDEDLVRNQDDEFNFRLLKNGFKVYLSRSIKADYHVRASFKKLYKQYYQYGYWKVFVNNKHQTVTTLRQLFPLFFVLYLITQAITLLALPNLGRFGLVILGLYLILGVVFALKMTRKGFFKVLLTFLTLHFSYGLGYLEGVINFIILGRKPRKAKLSR